MASTVVFALGSVSATVNGPESPTQVRHLPRWVTARTADHTRIVYQTPAPKTKEWTLNLRDLTTAQKAALQSFFDDTAQGPTNTFDYTHTDGNTYEDVRFLDVELAWERLGPNDWNLTVRLETTADIDA